MAEAASAGRLGASSPVPRAAWPCTPVPEDRRGRPGCPAGAEVPGGQCVSRQARPHLSGPPKVPPKVPQRPAPWRVGGSAFGARNGEMPPAQWAWKAGAGSQQGTCPVSSLLSAPGGPWRRWRGLGHGTLQPQGQRGEVFPKVPAGGAAATAKVPSHSRDLTACALSPLVTLMEMWTPGCGRPRVGTRTLPFCSL